MLGTATQAKHDLLISGEELTLTVRTLPYPDWAEPCFNADISRN